VGGPLLNQDPGLIAAAPVRGGSGAFYPTIAAGIAGETALVTSGVTVAGTTNGVIVGPAGWAAFNLIGRFAVLVDAAPGNGLAAVYARVIAQAGATLTIDSQVNVGVAVSVDVVEPATLTVNGNVSGNASIDKALILNLGGCVSRGQINITAGALVWIRNGDITDGILVTTATPSILKLGDVRVARRTGTVYAIRRTNASNVGRFDAKGLQASGVISFAQGRAAYILEDCLFPGIDDGIGNGPVRLWDADGIAIVANNGLVMMQNCSNPGCILYSNGAAGNLGFTGFFNANLDIRAFIGGDLANAIPPDDFSFGLARGGSTFSFAPTSGGLNAKLPYECINALLRCDNFTGTATMNLSTGAFVELDATNADEAYFVRFTGTAFTGTATFTGTDVIGMIGENAFVGIVAHEAPSSTGTCNVTNAGAINVQGANSVGIVTWKANQPVGPTTTVSPNLNFDDIPFGLFAVPVFAGFGVTDIDTGTTTISSLVTGNSIGDLDRNMISVFGGANVTISGIWRIAFAAGFGGAMRIARHGGTAGTLTCSATFFGKGPYFGNFPQFGHAIGAGATVVVSGDRTISDCIFDSAFAFLFAGTATSVVSGGGAITLINCVMQATGIEIADSDVAGASVTVPAGVVLRFCAFEGSFATRTDPDGTYAGSCNLFMTHCKVNGSFTPHGTNFPSIICEETTFSGDPDALLFTATGQADPATTFLFWNCSAPNGRMHTLANTLTLGKPVWGENGFVADSGAATTAEFVGQLDATARLVNIAAAANSAAGVLFGATGAAGTRQRAIVHGFGFVVADDATINQGNGLAPGAAVLGRVIQASVKRIGYALATTAAGFPTAAGQRVYARIHVDR